MAFKTCQFAHLTKATTEIDAQIGMIYEDMLKWNM